MTSFPITLPAINNPELLITFEGSFTPSISGKVLFTEWTSEAKTPQAERSAIIETELAALCGRYIQGEHSPEFIGKPCHSVNIVNLVAALDTAWSAYSAAQIVFFTKGEKDSDAAKSDKARSAYVRARQWAVNFPAQDVEDFAIMSAALLEVPMTDLEGNECNEFIFYHAQEARGLWRSSQNVMGQVLPVTDFSGGPRAKPKGDYIDLTKAKGGA